MRTFAALACALTLLQACAPVDHGADGTPPEASVFTYTGVLRSGFTVEHGEHTGWALESAASPTGWLETDVSGVESDARRLDGARVVVTGAIIQRHSPVHPKRQVLLARTIAAAPR